MKKLVLLAASMLLCAATTASAEHALLITDVIDPGHVEAQVAWEYSHYRHLGTGEEVGFSLGAGIAKNLQLNVSLPYVINESLRVEEEDKNGWGSLTAGLQYRILKESPVSLTAAFDVTFDTASSRISEGKHSYVYAPSLAVSKNIGHEQQHYAFYKAAFDSDGADKHTIGIGIEKEFNHFVTVDGRFDTTFSVGKDELFGHEVNQLKAYTLDLAAYLQVAKNLYVVPSIGGTRYDFKESNANEFKAGTALYVMF